MEHKTKIISVITILLIFFGFLSYQYLTDTAALNNVEVTVESITFQELRLSYCKLKLSVNIDNPSQKDISEVSAVFDVFIADNYVGSGIFPKSFLSAQSNSNKDVSLTIYYADMASAVINGIQNGNFDLTVEGKAKGTVFFNLITISKEFVSTYSYS